MDRRIQVSASILSVTILILTSLWPWANAAQAQEKSVAAGSQAKKAEYVGLTKCAACHFDQFKDWRGSVHSKAYEILPAKYRSDASCLKCHTTGVAGDAASHQFGVSCEGCHGPGENHANLALRFVNELITEQALASLRENIQRLDMRQCVDCHFSQAHKKHPPFDRDAPLPSANEKESGKFFQSIHGNRSTIQAPLNAR